MALNNGQATAITSMLEFLENPDKQFFLLKGPAGTGKTYCIRQLLEEPIGRVIFTAPTNKAVKVLRETLTSSKYKPECKTIYSLLGLRLEPSGEVKVLRGPDKDDEGVDLSMYSVVLVDEASMVGKVLIPHIRRTALEHNVKFIFMGDQFQLPPVGEDKSPCWNLSQDLAELTEPMRFDNQILPLATAIREQISAIAPCFTAKTDNAEGEGIWKFSAEEFRQRIEEAAAMGRFSSPADAKAIAWRNVTVNSLNETIRFRIFNEAAKTLWLPEDRIAIREPVKELGQTKTCAQTDDEGVVTKAFEDYHPMHEEFKVWRLTVTLDEGRIITLHCLHPEAAIPFKRRLEELAAAAKVDKRNWRQFWALKESFHSAVHAYAITAHRSQGSTYRAAFVDWRDILINPNRQEAFRCLYVACTRAKKELYLGG